MAEGDKRPSPVDREAGTRFLHSLSPPPRPCAQWVCFRQPATTSPVGSMLSSLVPDGGDEGHAEPTRSVVLIHAAELDESSPPAVEDDNEEGGAAAAADDEAGALSPLAELSAFTIEVDHNDNEQAKNEEERKGEVKDEAEDPKEEEDEEEEEEEEKEQDEDDEEVDAAANELATASGASSLDPVLREQHAAHVILRLLHGGTDECNAAGSIEFYKKCSALSAAHCLPLLHTSLCGLSASAAASRASVFGANSIDSDGGETWYRQLFRSFLHPFNVLLLALAIIAGVTDDMASVGLLGAMVAISVAISFGQERKAHISAQALKKRVTPKAIVRRPPPPPMTKALAGRNTHAAAQTAPIAAASGGDSDTDREDNGSASHPAPPSELSIELAPTTGTGAVGGMSSRQSSFSSPRLRPRGITGSPSFVVEEVVSTSLVPGDLVLLAAGSLVPADLRLVSCTGLLINQTMLTGESLPVEKSALAWQPPRRRRGASCSKGAEMLQVDLENLSSDTHWLRRSNLAFMGSSVESGSGLGVVIATGPSTYFGRNAGELQEARPLSAFAKGVQQVTYVLMAFTAVMLPIVILINGATSGDWKEAGLFGAAVAVGVSPAMMPMICSANLSLAARKLSKKKCLVKRLEAIQNLGAISVLCTDKTGTLTDDRVTLHDVLDTEGNQQRQTSAEQADKDAKEARTKAKVAAAAVAELAAAPSLAVLEPQPAVPVLAGHVMDVAYTIAKQQQGFRNVLDHAIVRAFEHSSSSSSSCSSSVPAGTEVEVAIHTPLEASDAANTQQEDKAKTSMQLKKQRKNADGDAGTAQEANHHLLPISQDIPAHVKLPPHWGRAVWELPFDFRRRRMSILVDFVASSDDVGKNQPVATAGAARLGAGKERLTASALYCKGALAETLDVCSHVLVSAASTGFDATVGSFVAGIPAGYTVLPKDAAAVARVHALGQELARKGLRVLAVAQKLAPVSVSTQWSVLDESGLILVGLLTFLDQPKASALPALERLADLSIAVKVLTGDNPLVARQVCAELGMDSSKMLTGDDMGRLTDDDDDPALQQLFADTVVFSQLTPHDKARVVRCLRFRGDTVALLGDGINDCLAMRESDCGISVDTGAEIAKDAADIILTEKDLSVLGDAVITGRLTHANSIKYIKMAASSNFGNVFSLIFAAAFLPFLPMLPLQLLTQNLLYDVSQIAIPFDSMDAEYLRTPKHWSGGNLASFMLCIGPVSSVFDIATFMIAFYAYGCNDKSNDHEVAQFQTMWFLQGIMTQTLIVHMIRTERIPFVESRAPLSLCLTTVLIVALAFVVPYLPGLAPALGMVEPHGSFFAVLVGTMLAYSVLVFFVKKLYIRRFKEWL